MHKFLKFKKLQHKNNNKKYLKESSSLSNFAASNKTVVSAANASFMSALSTDVPVTKSKHQILHNNTNDRSELKQ